MASSYRRFRPATYHVDNQIERDGRWSGLPAPVYPREPGIGFQRSMTWTKRGLIKAEGQSLRRSHAACKRFICSFRRITPRMPKSSFIARSNSSKLSRLSRSQRHIAYAAEPKLSEVRTTNDTAQNDQGASSRRRPIRVRVSRLQSHLRDERPHPVHWPARSLARPNLECDGLLQRLSTGFGGLCPSPKTGVPNSGHEERNISALGNIGGHEQYPVASSSYSRALRAVIPGACRFRSTCRHGFCDARRLKSCQQPAPSPSGSCPSGSHRS